MVPVHTSYSGVGLKLKQNAVGYPPNSRTTIAPVGPSCLAQTIHDFSPLPSAAMKVGQDALKF